MPYKDPERQRAYQRDWHARSSTRTEQVNAAKKRARERNRSVAMKAKEHPCSDCGDRYPPFVMDFDHVVGPKVGNISKLVNMGVSVQILEAEINKCDLVCANCHRVRTHSGVV